ncbi:hypothetical protein SAMN05216350_101328 [Polaromonas sp. YR568]|nr:hypothetical protein SAMN05216350_101328 [Polaromonas sp. YR568]
MRAFPSFTRFSCFPGGGTLLSSAGRGRPACDSLFFASPKKSKQKKGDPTVCVPSLRYGQPAVLGPAGVKNNSPSAQTSFCPYPSGPALLGAARRGGEKEYRTANSQRQDPEYLKNQGHATACPWLSLSPFPIAPSWLGRGAQSQADQGKNLSERSELFLTPLGSSTAGCPQRSVGTQTAGRLSFAYFSLAKQRKVSCRRATPGQPNSDKSATAGARPGQVGGGTAP